MGKRRGRPGGYEEIAAHFRQKIDVGDLAPGDALPSMREVCEQFGAAITTVNRAFRLLQAEGRTVSKPGVGTIVRDQRFPITGSRRIKGITHPGEHIEWRYSRRTEAPAWVAEHLGAGECVERARTVRRENVIQEASRSWVRLDVVRVVPELDDAAPCDPTWQAVYTHRSGNEVKGITSAVYARVATDEDHEALGLDGKVHAVLFTRTVYATGGDVIGVGEAVSPPGQGLELEVS